jgi:hypothetical protein
MSLPISENQDGLPLLSFSLLGKNATPAQYPNRRADTANVLRLNWLRVLGA